MTDTITRTETILEDRGRSTRHPLLHTLSAAMRGALIAHLDGPQAIVAGTPRQVTVTVLVRRGLLRYDQLKIHRQSFLTDKGRDAAGACAEFEASQMLEMEALR